MLDFRVHTFLAVCEHMNYTRAAESLHITQPAVSQHIRHLEKLYQVTLFAHDGKKVKLTEAGRLFQQWATALKNDELLLRSRMLQQLPSEIPLHFGATMTIAEYVIAAPLAGYMARHPKASVQMHMGNTDQLLHSLKSGQLQFALVEGYFSPEEFDSLTFRREDFIGVCSSSHHFHKDNSCGKDVAPFQLQDMCQEPLLIREPGSGTRDILEKNLIAHNLTTADFPRVSEIGSMNAIIQLLLHDAGISFLYRSAVSRELGEKTLMEIPFSDFQLQHEFSFVWEKGSLFSDSYREIFEEFLAVADE